MSSPPADRAALRLELSPGELRCPKKGQMAKGRCTQLQEEMACTCAVAAAAGCAIGPVQAPPAPPAATPAPTPAAPPHSRLDLIRAAAAKARTNRMTAAPASPTATTTATAATVRDEDAAPADPAPSTTATATAAPAAAKETEMADTDKMLDAMRAEPARKWKREELCELRGTNLVLTGQALNWLKKKGVVENCGRGLWRLASGAKAEEPAPPKKAAPKKPAKKAPAPRPQRPAPVIASDTTGGGHARTVQLRSGGELTVSLSINVFDLDGTDLEFVFGVVDALASYER